MERGYSSPADGMATRRGIVVAQEPAIHNEYISDDDYMVFEMSECIWCGNYAPSDLYDENGERICIDCITEALQNDKVARAIRNYFEYG